MFDPITTTLIEGAPPLDGLNIEELPKRLTQAYADIVSARIRLRGAHLDGADASTTLIETLAEMRRLAATHEAYTALLPDRDNRVSAAFVAASAHQVCLMSIQSHGAEGQIATPIDESSVAPEVCATLLFLVGEAHADAAEAAKRIVLDTENASDVERALLYAIRRLAEGRLGALLEQETPDVPTDLKSTERAIQALLLMLLIGIRALALQLRRRIDRPMGPGVPESAASIFQRVKELCFEEIVDVVDGKGPVVSIYPGPLHLANLLLAVERNLASAALTRVKTPGGVEELGWFQIIRRMASKRPYLWRNHLQAIEQGYLEQGTSSAVSFPTGGGKSTLAELKIATALLRREKVVFLAPTHALVDQTTKALQDIFQSYNIIGDIEDEVALAEVIVLPEVIVTTPERCLMLFSIQPEAFSDLGLIVFDECHLLHPRDTDRSRRSVDAMLAIINLVIAAPNADLLLLSAMMRNAVELSEWIQSLTSRDCLALDLAWKPTRQVRGSVVYPASRIAELKAMLQQARRERPAQKTVPAPVKRQLTAQPKAFLSLRQTWASKDRADYTLLPLLDDNLAFSTGRSKGGHWYLTPNGNEISAAIAAAAASDKMKSLVFVQTTVFCESSAGKFREMGDWPAIELTEEETSLYKLSTEEMGGPEHCFLTLENDGSFKGGAASHHALLLREERHLHESLFKRKDGVNVLFATSTLAQGMNLPSEIVIIAGDSRFDPTADKMAQLEAHELLNAAGRAGRAGERAQGFVLVVPSYVIEFDDEKNLINEHWLALQSIFGQSDQCLIIDDPLTAILDNIHAGAMADGLAPYLLSKLPPSQADDPDSPARKILSKSFAAFRATARGQNDWTETRIVAAIAARGQIDVPAEDGWLEHVAGSTGIPIDILRSITSLVDNGALTGSAIDVILALLTWLAENPAYLFEVVRDESIEGLFGGEYAKLPTDTERAKMAIPALARLLPMWMSGVPLCDMEKSLLEKEDVGHCRKSRHFVLRTVPDLAFVASLPARIISARTKHQEVEAAMPTVLSTLSATVREGCVSPECLATRLNLGRRVSRVAAYQYYKKLLPFIADGDLNEDFEATKDRIRSADTTLMFTDLS